MYLLQNFEINVFISQKQKNLIRKFTIGSLENFINEKGKQVKIFQEFSIHFDQRQLNLSLFQGKTAVGRSLSTERKS